MPDWNTKSAWDNSYRVRAKDAAGRVIDPPVIIHFNRVVQKPWSDRQRDRLIEALKLTSTSSLVMIGGAFGWTADAFDELWPGFDIAVTDTSTVIQGEAGSSDEAELRTAIISAGHNPSKGDGAAILAKYASPERNRARRLVLNENSATQGSTDRVKASLGKSPDWIVSENVLPDFNDAEAIAFDAKLRSTYAPTPVAHVATMLRTVDPLDPSPRDPMFEFQHPSARQMNLKNLASWKTLLPNSTVIESRYDPAQRVEFL